MASSLMRAESCEIIVSYLNDQNHLASSLSLWLSCETAWSEVSAQHGQSCQCALALTWWYADAALQKPLVTDCKRILGL